MDRYEQQLLHGWESVFKKGQLTLWILLALKDGPKFMPDIKAFALQATHGVVDADEKSLYRALRRFTEAEMVTYTTEANSNGPDRKRYRLTDTGRRVLDAFMKRNIVDIFFEPAIQRLLRD